MENFMYLETLWGIKTKYDLAPVGMITAKP